MPVSGREAVTYTTVYITPPGPWAYVRFFMLDISTVE